MYSNLESLLNRIQTETSLHKTNNFKVHLTNTLFMSEIKVHEEHRTVMDKYVYINKGQRNSDRKENNEGTSAHSTKIFSL